MTTKADILRAIRGKCLDCCCYQPIEVRECTVYTCGLHPYRLGKDPNPSKRGFAANHTVCTSDLQQVEEDKT